MTSLALAMLTFGGAADAATSNVEVYGMINSTNNSVPAPFPLWHNSVSDRNGIADAGEKPWIGRGLEHRQVQQV